LRDDEQVRLDDATLQEARGEYADASATLWNLLAIDHDNPLLLLRRGVVEAEGSQPTAALRDFMSAARIDPGDPAPWQDMAVLDDSTGDHDRAAADRAHAQELARRLLPSRG
jgi:Flp pilus assembly protein TadD